MNFIKANIVLSGHGADHVSLFTDLPSSMPAVTDQGLILSFNVARNGAEAYMAKHFPNVPVTVIQYPKSESKLSR